MKIMKSEKYEEIQSKNIAAWVMHIFVCIKFFSTYSR